MSRPDNFGDAERKLEQAYLRDFPGEATRSLEHLPVSESVQLLTVHKLDTTLPIWERLSPVTAGQVLLLMSREQSEELLHRLDPSVVARVLTTLPEAQAEPLLSLLADEVGSEVRELMSYPPDSAGFLMDKRVRLFREDMTVREVVRRLREDARPGRRGFFVVDADGKLAGWVDMQDIALAARATRLSALRVPAIAFVDAMASREEVIETIERHDMSELAVVDIEGRLLGAIRPGALIEAGKVQASVSIQTMVGASKDERALSPVSFAVRKRLPWLQINLLTAFLAASVVGLFEQTIAQFTALAVLLPVVAGQSGNTGAQALAVTMRGLALREIRARHWGKVVFKELNVGFWNGVAVALTTALGVLIWSGSTGLTLVIGVSMVLSMLIAGVSGAAIPILLSVLGQDPAQSSSIVLTTVTDVAGFFSFLGIATMLAFML